MITTKNKKMARYIEHNRLHGLSKDAWKRFFPSKQKKSIYFYDTITAGYKFNMPDLNASIGISQFQSIDKFWLKRKKLYDLYRKKLSPLPIKFQIFDNSKVTHSYHLFLFYLDNTKTTKKRDDLVRYLDANNIGFGIHYRSINSMSFYKKKFKWGKENAPNSYEVGNSTISLPLYPHLEKNKVDYISEKITNFFD